jgi:predicted TIM-barrel fold metal-dependent hydrolase
MRENERSELYSRLRAAAADIQLIDTHEHLMSEETRLSQDIDLFHWLQHYISSDLVSSGMPPEGLQRLRDTGRPLDQRWAEFEPTWKNARTTAYGRVLLRAARDLFGVEDINSETYQTLSNSIAMSNREGWYEHVLKDKGGVALAILDPIDEVDPTPLEEIDRRFFAPVYRPDAFITVCNRIDLIGLERKTDVAIHSLDDLLTAMTRGFEDAMAAGVVGVKIGVAYSRCLRFEKVSKSEAERLFNQLSRYPVVFGATIQQPPLSWTEVRPLQDYLLHEIIRRCLEYDLPIQVHTGLQEGNGNYIANADPTQLANLFVEYSQARFDLFHVGYPYVSEAATLAKNFQNVYLDMCWVYAISPWVARRALHEFIETVPANKIFGFGGDYIFVEGTYGHAELARDAVSRVLAEKVSTGYLTEDEASALLKRLLRDNALSFYGLEM